MAITAAKVKSISNKIIKGTASKYKESIHIPMLIKHFGKGGDLCHFLNDAEIVNGTFYNWCEVYPKFKLSYKIGKQLAHSYWLDLIPNKLQEKGNERFNFNVWRTIMRNRFGQTDSRKISIPELKECKTQEDRIQCIVNNISDGKLTSAEASSLSSIVLASLKVEEFSSLTERLEAAEKMLTEQLNA